MIGAGLGREDQFDPDPQLRLGGAVTTLCQN
jgi:hypothetical protein